MCVCVNANIVTNKAQVSRDSEWRAELFLKKLKRKLTFLVKRGTLEPTCIDSRIVLAGSKFRYTPSWYAARSPKFENVRMIPCFYYENLSPLPLPTLPTKYHQGLACFRWERSGLSRVILSSGQWVQRSIVHPVRTWISPLKRDPLSKGAGSQAWTWRHL